MDFVYDSDGNLIETSCLGVQTKYVYDKLHRMTEVINAKGITTVRNAYDALNRVTAQAEAGSDKYITFDYEDQNGGGTKVTITNRLGATALVETDSKGQKIRSVNANGDSVTYRYDKDGKLTEQTNGNGGKKPLTATTNREKSS